MSSAKAVSFLAKKSWHTGTMRHMEKVWKAEERAKAEESKTKELQQELAEEREMEALRKAHETLTGTTRSDRVQFLYSEPLLNEPSAEDYLTGAKYSDKDDENDVKNIRDKPGALWLEHPYPGSDSIQDKRAKIREDPLFSIRKEEQNQREALKKNPVKMQRLREEILMQKLREGLGKERKEKRKRKADKIDKKNKRHKLNDGEVSAHKSLETPSSPGNSSPPRNPSRRAEGHDLNHHTDDRNHPTDDRHRTDDRNHHTDDRNHRTNDRHRTDDRHDDRHHRNNDLDDHNHRDNGRTHGIEDRHPRRHDDRNRREITRTLPKKESPTLSTGSSSSRKKSISEEEKRRRLEEMQRDAESVAKERLERVTKYNEEDAVERVQAVSKDGKNDPHFINAMGKEIFSGKETASIADRVKRNIYYIQKTNLDERGLFK